MKQRIEKKIRSLRKKQVCLTKHRITHPKTNLLRRFQTTKTDQIKPNRPYEKQFSLKSTETYI